MTYKIEIIEDSSPLFIPSTLGVEVTNYSKHAQLGYFDANIRITGGVSDIFEVLEWINLQIKIYSPNTLVWSGYVNSAEVRLGAITYTVSLDTMYNSVAAVYTDENSAPIKTTYTKDDFSVDIFGEKQLLLSVDNASSAVITNNINRILTETKYPKAKFEISPLSSGVAEANIRCLGIIQKANWLYYERDFGLIENTSQTSSSVKTGLSATGTIAFENDGDFVAENNGSLLYFDKDQKIEVSGSVSNDGTYTILEGTNQEGETYEIAAGNAHFSGSTLSDDGEGLTIFDKHDLIQVSGTSSNNGFYVVYSVETDGTSLEVESSFSGENPGGAVSVVKGSKIRLLNASLTDETISCTIDLYGRQIAQSFTPDHSFEAKYLVVEAQAIGSPSGGLELAIYDDNSNEPGSELGSIVVAQDDISKNGGEIIGTLGTKVSISASTKYWLVVSDQNTSGTNYHQVKVDEDLNFTDGSMLLGDGSGNWVARTTDADLIFKVIAGEETTEQIDVLLNTLPGVVNTYAQVSSGHETAPFRDGTFLAIEELTELLNQGTDNELRLLLEDDENFNITVFEEDSKPLSEATVDYFIDPDARIYNRFLSPLENGIEIVGKWVGLINFIPGSVNTSFITDPSPVFIEFLQHNVYDDTYTIQSKVEQGLFNIRG